MEAGYLGFWIVDKARERKVLYGILCDWNRRRRI